MGENNRKPVRGRSPIRRHPLFPAFVELCVGILFGLASLAVPLSVLEWAMRALHADVLIPLAAPPLGDTARMLLALLLAAVGLGVGAVLARRMAGETSNSDMDAPTAAAAQPVEGIRRRRNFIPATAVAYEVDDSAGQDHGWADEGEAIGNSWGDAALPAETSAVLDDAAFDEAFAEEELVDEAFIAAATEEVPAEVLAPAGEVVLSDAGEPATEPEDVFALSEEWAIDNDPGDVPVFTEGSEYQNLPIADPESAAVLPDEALSDPPADRAYSEVADVEPSPLSSVALGGDRVPQRHVSADLHTLSYSELLDRLALAFHSRRERLDALAGGGMPAGPLPESPYDRPPEVQPLSWADVPVEKPAVPPPPPVAEYELDHGEWGDGVFDQPEIGQPFQSVAPVEDAGPIEEGASFEGDGPFDEVEADAFTAGVVPEAPTDIAPTDFEPSEFTPSEFVTSEYDSEWDDDWDDDWDDEEGEGALAPDFGAPRKIITASFAALADCSDEDEDEEEEGGEEEDDENESGYSSLLDFGRRSGAKEPCLRVADAEREAAAEALTSHMPDEDALGEFPGQGLVRDCITSPGFHYERGIEDGCAATGPSPYSDSEADFGEAEPAPSEQEQLRRDALGNLHRMGGAG